MFWARHVNYLSVCLAVQSCSRSLASRGLTEVLFSASFISSVIQGVDGRTMMRLVTKGSCCAAHFLEERAALLVHQMGIRTVGRGGGGKHLDVPLKRINISPPPFFFKVSGSNCSLCPPWTRRKWHWNHRSEGPDRVGYLLLSHWAFSWLWDGFLLIWVRMWSFMNALMHLTEPFVWTSRWLLKSPTNNGCPDIQWLVASCGAREEHGRIVMRKWISAAANLVLFLTQPPPPPPPAPFCPHLVFRAKILSSVHSKFPISQIITDCLKWSFF